VRISTIELRATVADHRLGPKDPFPQVAFAGRSNVGKSSLLNTLFGRRLASVSKDPGKTRTINYYLVNKSLYFVDLPGYGFAKVSRGERAGWGKRITSYLEEEERLRLVIGLVDPRIATSPLDVDLSSFVRSTGKSFTVVLTKADKLGRGALARAAKGAQEELALDDPPLTFSALTGEGKQQILAAIARVVAA
jgi:GTP-binding protein